MSLQASWIRKKITGYHVVSMVIFWLLRSLRICSSRSDLRGHVTGGRRNS